MRLRPPVTKEEVLVDLRQEAERNWGPINSSLEQSIETLAEAMAAVSGKDPTLTGARSPSWPCYRRANSCS